MKKTENLVANLNGKTEYAIHIRNLKQAWDHGSLLKNYAELLNVIILIYCVY